MYSTKLAGKVTITLSELLREILLLLLVLSLYHFHNVILRTIKRQIYAVILLSWYVMIQHIYRLAKGPDVSFLMDVSMISFFKEALGYTNEAERIILKGLIKKREKAQDN